MRTPARRFLAVLLLLCALSMSLMPGASAAESKVVRVAYLLSPGYQEGGENEYKTGQGYEYLQKIAGYTGWTYEYVYGGFSELLAMLEDGRVDLMGNLSYTEARAERIDYSTYEQGRESYYLFVNGEMNAVAPGHYGVLNGMKVGVNARSFQAALWEDWCAENGVQCEIVPFETLQEREDALNNHTIDATIGGLTLNSTEQTQNWKCVLKIGASAFYFGVSKQRPDLLEELNHAQETILEEDPYYNETLAQRYIHDGLLAQVQPSANEIAWLKQRGGVLRYGILDDYLPISDSTDAGVQGVIPDFLTEMAKNYAEYGLRFEPVIFPSYHTMLDALKAGEIDIIGPVYGDYWVADREGIALSNAFMSTSMLLLTTHQYRPDEVKRVAINGASPIQSAFADIVYPNCEHILYPTMREAAEALSKGRADIAFSSSYSYHIRVRTDSHMENIDSAAFPEIIPLAFGVAKSNPELLTFLNRALSTVDETQVFNALVLYSHVDKKTTLSDYVAANPVTAMLISGSVVALLLIIILRLKKAIRRSNTDTMTGLLNKEAMRRQVQELLNMGGTLFMIDLDNFKGVNDHLGHEAGDALIRHFADCLRRIFRGRDLLARFGGDEFVVFLPVSVCEEGIIRAKVLQMEVALADCEILKKNPDVPCSVSAGVLRVEKGQKLSYTEAFEKADAALYEAKKKGKNTYSIYP